MEGPEADIYTCMKLKKIIEGLEEVQGLSPRDIYNFYFLWYTAVHQPKLVSTPYGKEIMDHYLGNFRKKYVSIFRLYLARQIAKYISRGRVDPDFPKLTGPELEKMSGAQLRPLMAKTFRSDMQRRNDRWDMIAEFLENLEKASNAKDIFTWINQLNNAVHNTQTRVMDKTPNYYSELFKAFQTVDKATNPHLQLKSLVDKDIRDLWNQEEEGDPHEFDTSGGGGKFVERVMMREGLERMLRVKESMDHASYQSGVNLAKRDKLSGTKRDLSGYPDAFVKGYKTVHQGSKWNAVNDRITNLLAMLGRSYGDR